MAMATNPRKKIFQNAINVSIRAHSLPTHGNNIHEMVLKQTSRYGKCTQTVRNVAKTLVMPPYKR